MKPRTYLREYQSLYIDVPGDICGERGPIQVGPFNAQRYTNTGSSGTVAPTNIDAEAQKQSIRLLAFHRKQPVSPDPVRQIPVSFTAQSVAAVYSGKASPAEIGSVLLLRALYEETSAGTIRARTWASPDSLITQLNAHCEHRIGLDCLGFVANYINQEKSKNWDPTTRLNADMWRFRGGGKGVVKLRAKPSDAAEKDVIVYLFGGDLGTSAKSRHIAVIDNVQATGSGVLVDIAESLGNSGTGPNLERAMRLENTSTEGEFGPVMNLFRNGAPALVYVAPFALIPVG